MPKLPRNIGCSIEGCEGQTFARGFCRRHYPQSSVRAYKPRFRRGRVSCKRSVAENLAACSERDEKTGCLIWIGAFDGDYGSYGSARRAHRVSYEESFGPIPAGQCVCHRCDTPACIEPTHLFLGTSQENTRDRMEKGRHAFVKLTADEVRAIRSDPRPQTQIAHAYGINPTTVRRILKRKAWRFVA